MSVGEEAAEKIGELFGRTKAFKANMASIIDRIVAERGLGSASVASIDSVSNVETGLALRHASEEALMALAIFKLTDSEKHYYEIFRTQILKSHDLLVNTLRAAYNLHAQQTPAVARENESPWIKTSERPPTEKDADRHDQVFALESPDEFPNAVYWQSVNNFPSKYWKWMPIPALPKE